MIYFLLLHLPQKLPEHENPHNGALVPLKIFGLFALQCAHRGHIKKRMCQKNFFLDSFVVLFKLTPLIAKPPND